MATLEEIRAKLLAQQNKNENNNNGGGDRAVYPHWNIDDDTTAVTRFLPDGDPNNTFFWAERLVIKIPFAGIKGETDKEVTVQVPCMEMYKKPDPILTEIRPWWNDNDLKEIARKYWKKKSYIFQGFVVTNPLKEDNPPENPIRRFIINPQIFTTIKASLMDPDFEDLPTDYNTGIDFRLTKTRKGQYADYSTSSWSRKSRALTDEERDAIQQYGLFNLSEFLPKEPSDEEVEVIKAMFKDSVDGEPYDPSKYSNYYKPNGFFSQNNQSNSTPAQTATKPVAKDDVPFETDDKNEAENTTDALAKLKARASESNTEDTGSNEGKQDASKILEMLRNRNK